MSCDYRNSGCSTTGKLVDGTWCCDNHLVARVDETATFYNAAEYMKVRDEVLGPWERERLGKLPMWAYQTIEDLVHRIYNLRKAASPAENGGCCTWTFDDNDYATMWETSCGEAFQFFDGGPTENKAKFCQYCGKRIEEMRTSYDDDEDDELPPPQEEQ